MLTSLRTLREISHSSILAEQGRLIAFPNWPLKKSNSESLTLRHIWRPWTSFRLGWLISSLWVCLRRKSRIAARIAGPVIILCALPGFASAACPVGLITDGHRDIGQRGQLSGGSSGRAQAALLSCP